MPTRLKASATFFAQFLRPLPSPCSRCIVSSCWKRFRGVASSPISSGPTDYLLVITVELVSISSTPAVCHHGGDAAGQAPGPSDAHGHYRRLRVQRGGPRHATGEARHCGRRNVGPCLQLLPLRYGTRWRYLLNPECGTRIRFLVWASSQPSAPGNLCTRLVGFERGLHPPVHTQD